MNIISEKRNLGQTDILETSSKIDNQQKIRFSTKTSDNALHKDSTHAASGSEEHGGHAVAWDYEYQEDWASQCKTGTQQSPINLIIKKAVCANEFMEFLFVPNENDIVTTIDTSDKAMLS